MPETRQKYKYNMDKCNMPNMWKMHKNNVPNARIVGERM